MKRGAYNLCPFYIVQFRFNIILIIGHFYITANLPNTLTFRY